jgi:hypothetical protein
MPIPLATTTISVYRDPANLPGATVTDGYDIPTNPTPTVVSSGVRAQISTPSGNNTTTDGNRVVFTWRLACDVCDIASDDTLVNAEGDTFRVQWVRTRRGLGLDHVEGSLIQVEGVA